VRVADAERIAWAGGEPAVELVLGLLAEITALRERVDEHDRLLKRDSTNSSLAPSNDPPLTRQQRRASEPSRRVVRSAAGSRGMRARPGNSPHRSGSMITLTMFRSAAGAGVDLTAARSGLGSRFSVTSGSCRRSWDW
jgi:Family of unknown function (DUF6444)